MIYLKEKNRINIYFDDLFNYVLIYLEEKNIIKIYFDDLFGREK